MWLPLPMTHRSPIRSSATSPRSWPGTMPALRLTCAPIIVPVPTSIHRSPYRAPVGNPMIDPAPNAPNARPAGVSAVITPARCAAPHRPCTARQATRRRYLWSASLGDMIEKVTGP